MKFTVWNACTIDLVYLGIQIQMSFIKKQNKIIKTKMHFLIYIEKNLLKVMMN